MPCVTDCLAKPMKRLIVWTFALISTVAKGDDKSHQYQIGKTSEKITLDGHLNELAWQRAERKGKFIQHYPYDTSLSLSETEFMFSFDEQNLYCAVICYNRNPAKDYVLQTLKRDFSITNSDAVVLSISPFLDGQNGFSFGVTPRNSQREGAIENGGVFGVTTAWDQIWHSATRITTDTWFAEFQIPFKSIRFAEGNNVWKFNLARADFKNNEVSTWVKVPRNFNISVLNFGGELVWPEPPVRKGKNIALIPYVSTVATGKTPYPGGEIFSKNQPRIGFDGKIGLSSSLNLDVTVNPDFAQVDVDVQQLNLTRYNLYFPERRQFFIENSDLFANFGFTQIRPFFSRRIGLGSQTNIPIDAGLRLTGKINNKLRIGAMMVQTRGTNGFLETGSKNYLVLATQYKVFKASNIGWILVTDQDGSRNIFGQNRNTISGLEYNLQSKDTRWVGKAFVQKAFYQNSGTETWSHASYLNYRTIHWDIAWNHEYVGKDFRARTGFVPRTENYDPVTKQTRNLTYYRLEPWVFRTFYPKKSVINNYSFNLYNSSYLDSMLRPTEVVVSGQAEMMLQNSTEFRVSLLRNDYNLYLPFSPLKSPAEYMIGKYGWYSGTAGFTSNNRKKLNGIVDVYFGNYYSGKRYALAGSLNWRRQPWGVFSLTYRHEDINLGFQGHNTYDLLGTKVDISFSTTMYFTCFLQYNTQADNVNVNLRYQWRYKPLSDFFVVYTENYNPQFRSKDRVLALKLVYWFNT